MKSEKDKSNGKEKPQFYRKASDNNGTVRVNIPGKIAEHLNLEEGDTIGFQTEYTEKHGPYASFWNHTRQGDEQVVQEPWNKGQGYLNDKQLVRTLWHLGLGIFYKDNGTLKAKFNEQESLLFRDGEAIY